MNETEYPVLSNLGLPLLQLARMAQNGVDVNSLFKFSIIQSEEEQEQVYQFMQHHFRVQEPITSAINCTEEDTSIFYRDICSNGFKKPYSIVAKSKEGELAGICLNAVYDQLPSSNCNPNEENRQEYSREISEGPYTSQNANRLVALIELTEKGIDKLIPRSVKKVFKIDIISVHPSFTGHGLGSEMVKRSVQMARELDCEYVYTCASAKASNRIFTRFGFVPVKTIPFDKFLENGQPVYKDLHDGGTQCTLMTLKL
uniref:aralkylamine N-acetyltransferase n=1 Tax=Ditylenchus dipsaci TaxID=166011 RepID=A0A915CW47_9BILA